MRFGRIVAMMFGAILALAGIGAIAGSGVMLTIHATQRGSDGYYRSPTQRLETPTAALVGYASLGSPGRSGWPEHPLGTVRVTVTPATTAPVFVGIAPASDVRQWLAGSAYTRIDELGWRPVGTRTENVPGDRVLSPPAPQRFWAASAAGAGEQTLTWASQWGDWAVVVANADGSSTVVADVAVGSDTGMFLPAGLIVLALGVLFGAGGVALAVIAVRDSSESAPVEAPASVPGAYPVRLEGRLEPGLSRWLWLIKWALAIPHYLVLAVLWLAMVPLTAVAGASILVTGRYPRAIFDFNVGVMRWTWRVSFYTFSALATDRYPPFTLASDPTYPADLVVDYPQRLSRWLVLVKWWLLAIPHYLIVGLFVGGMTAFGWGRHTWWIGSAGGGLIGLLALVAAIVLLITGTYPAAVFDVVVGLNRWCYRVLAYAGLMRDEYPPFRLDIGGADPGTPTTPLKPPPQPADRAPVAAGTGTGGSR